MKSIDLRIDHKLYIYITFKALRLFVLQKLRQNETIAISIHACFRISKDEACGKSKELKQVNGRFLKRIRKLEDKNAN